MNTKLKGQVLMLDRAPQTLPFDANNQMSPAMQMDPFAKGQFANVRNYHSLSPGGAYTQRYGPTIDSPQMKQAFFPSNPLAPTGTMINGYPVQNMGSPMRNPSNFQPQPMQANPLFHFSPVRSDHRVNTLISPRMMNPNVPQANVMHMNMMRANMMQVQMSALYQQRQMIQKAREDQKKQQEQEDQQENEALDRMIHQFERQQEAFADIAESVHSGSQSALLHREKIKKIKAKEAKRRRMENLDLNYEDRVMEDEVMSSRTSRKTKTISPDVRRNLNRTNSDEDSPRYEDDYQQEDHIDEFDASRDFEQEQQTKVVLPTRKSPNPVVYRSQRKHNTFAVANSRRSERDYSDHDQSDEINESANRNGPVTEEEDAVNQTQNSEERMNSIAESKRSRSHENMVNRPTIIQNMPPNIQNMHPNFQNMAFNLQRQPMNILNGPMNFQSMPVQSGLFSFSNNKNQFAVPRNIQLPNPQFAGNMQPLPLMNPNQQQQVLPSVRSSRSVTIKLAEQDHTKSQNVTASSSPLHKNNSNKLFSLKKSNDNDTKPKISTTVKTEPSTVHTRKRSISDTVKSKEMHSESPTREKEDKTERESGSSDTKDKRARPQPLVIQRAFKSENQSPVNKPSSNSNAPVPQEGAVKNTWKFALFKPSQSEASSNNTSFTQETNTTQSKAQETKNTSKFSPIRQTRPNPILQNLSELQAEKNELNDSTQINNSQTQPKSPSKFSTFKLFSSDSPKNAGDENKNISDEPKSPTKLTKLRLINPDSPKNTSEKNNSPKEDVIQGSNEEPEINQSGYNTPRVNNDNIVKPRSPPKLSAIRVVHPGTPRNNTDHYEEEKGLPSELRTESNEEQEFNNGLIRIKTIHLEKKPYINLPTINMPISSRRPSVYEQTPDSKNHLDIGDANQPVIRRSIHIESLEQKHHELFKYHKHPHS